MSKPCSPKSKFINNPGYECGPKGRYRIKEGLKKHKVTKELIAKKKHSLSGYNLYSKANFAIVRASLLAKAPTGQKVKLGDVSRALGAQWKVLDKASKQIYLDQAKKLKPIIV